MLLNELITELNHFNVNDREEKKRFLNKAIDPIDIVCRQ